MKNNGKILMFFIVPSTEEGDDHKHQSRVDSSNDSGDEGNITSSDDGNDSGDDINSDSWDGGNADEDESGWVDNDDDVKPSMIEMVGHQFSYINLCCLCT